MKPPADYEIDLTIPPERRAVEGSAVVVGLLLTITGVIGFAFGYQAGQETEPPSGPGFEICTDGRC